MLPGDIAHFYSEPSNNSAQVLSFIGLERKKSQLANLSRRHLEQIKEKEEQNRREAKQSLELAQGMSGLSSDTLGWVMFFSFLIGFFTFLIAGPFCLAPILLGLLIGVPAAYAAKSSEKELAIKQAQKKLNLAEREILKVEQQLRNAGQSKSAAPISFEIREASVTEESQSLSDNLEAELRKAKGMLDQGLITEEEFQTLRKRLIDKFE